MANVTAARRPYTTNHHAGTKAHTAAAAVAAAALGQVCIGVDSCSSRRSTTCLQVLENKQFSTRAMAIIGAFKIMSQRAHRNAVEQRACTCSSSQLAEAAARISHPVF